MHAPAGNGAGASSASSSSGSPGQRACETASATGAPLPQVAVARAIHRSRACSHTRVAGAASAPSISTCPARLSPTAMRARTRTGANARGSRGNVPAGASMMAWTSRGADPPARVAGAPHAAIATVIPSHLIGV